MNSTSICWAAGPLSPIVVRYSPALLTCLAHLPARIAPHRFAQAGVECKFPTTAPPLNPNFSRGQLAKKGTSKHKVVGTSDCDESTSDSSEPKEATSRHAVATSRRATSRRPNVPTSQQGSRKRKGSNQQRRW